MRYAASVEAALKKNSVFTYTEAVGYTKPFCAPQSTASLKKQYDESQYIVKFNDGASLSDIENALAGYGYRLLSSSSQRSFQVTLGDADSFYEKYAGIIECFDKNSCKTLSAELPQDPLYASQWYYEKLNMEAIWSGTLGSSETIIAVLDSGVNRAHEEFAKANILTGYDAIKRTEGVNDDPLGHGTAVIGVIAAGYNNGKGVSALLPKRPSCRFG